MLLVALAELVILNAPGYAAINCAVESVRRLSRPRAANLVNAVLRHALRRLEAGTLQDPLAAAEADVSDEEDARRAASGAEASVAAAASAAAVDRLADGFSFPQWIARRWAARLGAREAAQLMRASNRVPAYGLRPSGGLTLEALAAELESCALRSLGFSSPFTALHRGSRALAPPRPLLAPPRSAAPAAVR